jgi:hypothetical protein
LGLDLLTSDEFGTLICQGVKLHLKSRFEQLDSSLDALEVRHLAVHIPEEYKNQLKLLKLQQ